MKPGFYWLSQEYTYNNGRKLDFTPVLILVVKDNPRKKYSLGLGCGNGVGTFDYVGEHVGYSEDNGKHWIDLQGYRRTDVFKKATWQEVRHLSDNLLRQIVHRFGADRTWDFFDDSCPDDTYAEIHQRALPLIYKSK
jgi:hypothetical protein